MKFQVHGDVDVEVSGQIIIAHICGPWNLELIQLFRNLVSPQITKVSKQGSWSLIVQITGSTICPPDALMLIKQGADADISGSQRGCTSYVISPDTEGYNLMLPIWYDIYRGKIPFEIFATLDEAISWTKQHLASASIN